MGVIVLRYALSTTDVSDLPTEFRIFKAGVNTSTKGDFLFDSASAESVMREYKAHGVDLMIDREHDTLNEHAGANRSDANDAMGYCALEVRGGELWAVNVRWGVEGETRLREKRQRYISPAFMTDEQGRVTELLNVGLVSMPALDRAPALVAASRKFTASERASLYINRARLARTK